MTESLIAAVAAAVSVPFLVVFLGQQLGRINHSAELFRPRITACWWLGSILWTASLQARAQWIAYLSGDLPFEPWLSLVTAAIRLVGIGLILWTWGWRRNT